VSSYLLEFISLRIPWTLRISWDSVILGIGYLLGNLLGGIFAQIGYFDGLALVTVLLVGIGMASIGSLLIMQRKTNVQAERASNP
jgi:hypothetical protein